MQRQRLRMVVGLGNPGRTYRDTRHNAGFLAVDHLAGTYAVPVARKKFDAIYGRGIVEGVDVIIAKPMAFMNRSGQPVRNLSDYFKISIRDMLVVHDDIDLEFGRLKIKEKGGDGGHKGIRSIMDAFGGGDFTRLRIGIGRAAPEISVTHHVLGTFHAAEKKLLDQIIGRTREAVVTILCQGTEMGMNRFNDRRITVNR